MTIHNITTLLKKYKTTSIYKNIYDINELMSPLRKIGLIYFAYIKYDLENTLTGFISDDNVLASYASNLGFLYEDPCNSPVRLLKPGCYYSNESMHKITLNQLFPHLSPDHFKGFTIIKDNKNGDRENFYFYVANVNFQEYQALEKFANEFDKKATYLIKKADRIRIPIIFNGTSPLSMAKSLATGELRFGVADKPISLLDHGTYNYCKFLQFATQYHLSHREAQCLYYILQGKLNREISYLLNLNYRTIDVCINRIKTKFGCKNKLALITKFLSLGIMKPERDNQLPINNSFSNRIANNSLLFGTNTQNIHDNSLLSPREKQCLELILQGKLNKQIAYILNLSIRTVEDYIDNIKHKLGCSNKMDLALTLLP